MSSWRVVVCRFAHRLSTWSKLVPAVAALLKSISAARLKWGPKSAGASPGPACYGQGGEQATLTDANLMLGYLDPGFFLGGEMALDYERAEKVIASRVAEPLDLQIERAAFGIHDIVSEDVARAFSDSCF